MFGEKGQCEADTNHHSAKGAIGEDAGNREQRHGELDALGLGRFDLITALEVIEHVADKQVFIDTIARHLAPGGLMVLSSPNRTQQSRLMMVQVAESLGAIPKGTHDWNEFMTPDELGKLLAKAGLTMGTPRGISWSPAKGLHLSDNLALNFIVTAVKA